MRKKTALEAGSVTAMTTAVTPSARFKGTPAAVTAATIIEALRYARNSGELMEAASTRVKTSAPGIVAVPNDKAEAEGVTEGTGDAEGVAPRFRLAVGVGDDEAVGVGDCVTLRRSGCADVDGRDVSEMVGEGEGVIEAEVVVEGEAVSVVEAEAPRDKDGVGDGVRVPVGGAPKDGDGDGDASGAKIVKRLL